MKKLLTICLMLIIAVGMYAKDYRVQSPNGKLSITVSADKQLTWQVAYQGKTILAPSVMSVDLGSAILGKNVKVRKASTRRIDETFATPVYKKAQVRDCCNELTLDCKDGYQVVFRAYDEGAAYRFVINRYVDKLHHEQVEFCFADDHKALIPY
ncbi:MAG: glycoside hydrolase family 97 N-terminal domain-containing protein, partial [Prevotella sp.]|nr:glycoside hydrolase family 97 N-terminal domain-containing protein [Prevotella sp.]